MLNATWAIYNPRFLDLKHKLSGRTRMDKVDSTVNTHSLLSEALPVVFG